MLQWTKVRLLNDSRVYTYQSGEYEVSQLIRDGSSGLWRACIGPVVFAFPFNTALDAMKACDDHALKTITNRLLGRAL